MDKYLRCITQALGLMIILGGFFNNEPIYLFIGTLVVVVFEILSIYYKENRFIWALKRIKPLKTKKCGKFHRTLSSH